MKTTRRQFATLLGTGSLAAALAPLVAAASAAAAGNADESTLSAENMAKQHEAMMAAMPGLNLYGSEQIAMLLYPGFTALDFVGPYFFLGGLMGAKVHLVTTEQTLKPVPSDLGLAIVPTTTLSRLPSPLDVLFLPGGAEGTLKVMQNKKVLQFLRDRLASTKYMTSVCTGSMILGAAGLLKGKQATSHWSARAVLADFGAVPVDTRFIRDGQIVTGAGVTAGLDLGIEIVRLLRGDPYAQSMMLTAEYAPQPPLKGGTYETTEPQLAEMMKEMFSPLTSKFREIAVSGRGSAG